MLLLGAYVAHRKGRLLRCLVSPLLLVQAHLQWGAELPITPLTVIGSFKSKKPQLAPFASSYGTSSFYRFYCAKRCALLLTVGVIPLSMFLSGRNLLMEGDISSRLRCVWPGVL